MTAFAWLHHDAFDLEALADVDALVPAPGAEHAGMELVFAAAAGFQEIDDLLDVLGAVLVRHQHRVGGFHDEQIRHADRRHHARFGAHQAVLHAIQINVAVHHVAVGVLRTDSRGSCALRHPPQAGERQPST